MRQRYHPPRPFANPNIISLRAAPHKPGQPRFLPYATLPLARGILPGCILSSSTPPSGMDQEQSLPF